MDRELEHYLESVENYLKRMPTSERIDVIKELKSYIEELQRVESLQTEQILERLGPAKEFAAGYLGGKINTEPGFSFKKLSMILTFYSLTFFTGMFVIPCGTIMAGALIFSGIVSPIAGAIKLIGFLLGFDVPFVVIQIGSFVAHPILAFFISVLFGIFFLWSGRALWRAVIRYIQKVTSMKRKWEV